MYITNIFRQIIEIKYVIRVICTENVYKKYYIKLMQKCKKKMHFKHIETKYKKKTYMNFKTYHLTSGDRKVSTSDHIDKTIMATRNYVSASRTKKNISWKISRTSRRQRNWIVAILGFAHNFIGGTLQDELIQITYYGSCSAQMRFDRRNEEGMHFFIRIFIYIYST